MNEPIITDYENDWAEFIISKCQDHCSTGFSLFYRQNRKITSYNTGKDLNYIYSSKKPLSGMNTLRTVLASTVRTVVVVVVVVVGSGFYVSP